MYDRDTRGGATWHELSHAHASSPALPERLHSPHGSRARIQHGWDPQHAHLRVSWRSQQPQQCIRTSVHPRQLKARRQTTSSAPVTPARSKRIALVRSDHRGRLVRRSSTQSPPGAPRPHQSPPAAPGGSRPSIDGFESILSVVRRRARFPRRS